MQKIADLFGEYKKPVKVKRRTERGDLIEYFTQKINAGRVADGFTAKKISYFAYFLSHVNIRDLYFLRSICDNAVRDGFRFDVTFWKAVKTSTKPSRKFKRTSPERT